VKSSLRLSAVVINLLLLAALAAIWIAFAPTMIGGRASYVVVDGNSMEPVFHQGDLVIIHAASTYNVGEIVTFHNAEVNAFVIHRVIAIEQDHYVFKGDNNSWIDTYRPTRAELIGKQWIHIPKLGGVMQWLRFPINMGIATGLLGGIFMLSMIRKPSQRGKQNRIPTANPSGMLESGLYLFGFLALIFLGLSIFAFTRPLSRPAAKIQYVQESQFSYSAAGAPVIYDTDMVRSGEPVFPRLTCFLDIGIAYNLLGDQLQGVSGSYQLTARVLDEHSGWQRTIPMNQPTAFRGNSFFTTSTLDVCQIVALVNTLKQETGLRASSYTLEVVTQVDVSANVAGNQITDSFAPRLVFQFDEVHFSLSALKGQVDPLRLSKESSMNNPMTEVNTLTIWGWTPTIGSIRVSALLGLALSISGLLLIGARILVTMQHSQEALIRLRYGGLMVNVYERDIAPSSTLIDVTTIDELAKLAERHNTVILHMTLNFLHCYLVQCNGLTYRYVFSAGQRGVVEIEPPRQQIINYTTNINKMSMVEVEPNEDEFLGYVVNQSRVAKTEVTDTVILRKISL
jgi:signal peptidase I